MARNPIHTATHEGTTGTRSSARVYTHAVFGFSLASKRAAYYHDALRRRDQEPGAEWIGRFERQAAEIEAQGDRWQVVSWHQGEKNAAKGLEAARSLANKYGTIFEQVVLVTVTREG